MGGREFKKLQARWYRRLKRSGFEDIEANGFLSSRGNGAKSFSVRMDVRTIEEQGEFYRLAGHFLHDFQWTDKTDRRIWEMFSRGRSIREIARAIKYSVGGTQKRLKKLLTGPFQDYRRMQFHDAN